MKRYLLSLAFFLVTYSLVAQTTDPFPPLDKASNLFEHEQQLREWREKFPKARAWKWAARQEYELLKRADFDGTLPTAQVFTDAIQLLDSQKATLSQSRTSKDPEWSPVGPYGATNLFGIGRVNCIAFHPTDPNIFYLGFGQGGIWKTTNGGKSYTPIGDQLPILRISAITVDPTNPQTIYISLGDFAYVGYDLYTADRKRNTHYGMGVWKSTDGGNTWNQTGLKNTLEEFTSSLTRSIWVNPANARELVVVGTKGIFKSFDAGTNWQRVSDRITSQLVQDLANPKVLYASAMYVSTIRAGAAGILRSTDAGNTWVELTTGINPTRAQRVEIAISPKFPSNLFAVTCNTNNTFEGFYRSKDGGNTWEKAPISNINLLGSSPQDTYGQGLYDLTIMAHPTDPFKVYVGGLVMFETEDRGNSWKQSFDYGTFVHPDQHALTYNPQNQTYYLCNDGGLYTTKQIIASTTQNLSNWQLTCNGINATSCYRLGVSADASQLITGSQDNNTYLSATNNLPWDNVFGGDGMEALITSSTIYGSYQYGNILGASKDFKNLFFVFPPKSNNDRGEWTTPFVLVKKTQKLLIAGGNVHEVEVGKNQDFLKKLSDFPWFNNTLFSIESSALAVSQTKPEYIYVAKRAQPLFNRPAQLLKTTNGGARWEDITTNIYSKSYISYLAVHDDFPDRVWATLSNFVAGEKIYFSDNGGKEWKNISYNLPNLPANCVTYDPDGVLYVGMDIGVYYLTEGSTTWQPLNTNLPNVIVSELEIHKPSKKIYAATFGRGLWVADLVNFALPSAAEFYGMTISLYPNPNQGNFTIKTDYGQIEAVEVIDALGRVMMTTNLEANALKFGKPFEVKNLATGMYFVRLKQGSQTKVVKMWVD